MTYSNFTLVSIEVKRVQTFIFAVPRLKAMLGANALLGETLRHGLTQLAEKYGCQGVSGLKASADVSDDPLTDDQPDQRFAQGILARDGGRFKCLFSEPAKAQEFAQAAAGLLSTKLPGVLFDICVGEQEEALQPGPSETHLKELPVLQICQRTGQGMASKSKDSLWVSPMVDHLEEAAGKFREGKTRDIVSLMRQALRLNAESGWQVPEDLSDLCASGYLALIHADGNGVGERYKNWRSRCESKDSLQQEAHGEQFFHSMRVAVRKAVVAALEKTFPVKGGKRPYEVLMLGGDDLLLACSTERAMDFACAYGEALSESDLCDGKPLTVGIGVAIAKAAYPIHRMHELAEALAGSAKRLYRALPEEEKCSVIDWQVVTQSWFGDLEAVRRQAELRRYTVNGQSETLILSARPYRLLGDQGLAKELTQIQQQAADHETEAQGAARSALRSLRQAFEAGRLSGERAFEELKHNNGAFFGDTEAWEELEQNRYLTRVLDRVGLMEISRLGSSHND